MGKGDRFREGSFNSGAWGSIDISAEEWNKLWEKDDTEPSDKPAKDVAEVKQRSGKKNMKVPKVG